MPTAYIVHADGTLAKTQSMVVTNSMCGSSAPQASGAVYECVDKL